MNNATEAIYADREFLSRRIAVTGATGMVGSHLVGELIKAGYSDITLLVRDSSRMARTFATLERLGIKASEGVLKVVETELTDPELLIQRVGTVDAVFNCAARIMSGDMTGDRLIANNVAIARSVVDWCVGSGVRKLIHISSISALGEGVPGGKPVDETCEPESVENYAAYGRSKYLSEREVWRGTGTGLQAVVVLPGVILGEGYAGENNSAALIPAISCGQPFYTNGLMSYVDVRDVARALVLLDRIPQAVGQRFILSAGDMSYKELIALAARAARKPRPFIPVGKGAIDLAYRAMQAGIRLKLLSDRGVTRENLGSVLRTTRYDGSKITRWCNFEYTPLPETIERVVKEFRRHERDL